MGRDIHSRFHLEEVDGHELLLLLLSHFSSGGSNNIDTYTLGRPDQPHTIAVTLNRKGRITTITCSPGFPDDELGKIEDTIVHTLIASQRPKVGQMFCFCHSPVTGMFRYRDQFQILPPPPDAPKPPVTVADHPFVLQFAYLPCSDWQINGHRLMRTAAGYVHLLNLISNRPIFLPSRDLPHRWVFEKSGDQFTSVWKQLGYTHSLPDPGGTLSAVTDCPSIDTIPRSQYYAEFRVRSGAPVALPDNTTTLIERAVTLPPELKNRFDRAIAWLYQADALWPESHSAAFVAQVTALECLVAKGPTCEACGQTLTDASDATCPSCGQPRYRVTRNFKEFLEKYAPTGGNQDLAAARGALYTARSRLVHGLDMLAIDEEPFAMMNIKADKERTQHQLLDAVTRIAIINWLNDDQRH